MGFTEPVSESEVVGARAAWRGKGAAEVGAEGESVEFGSGKGGCCGGIIG